MRMLGQVRSISATNRGIVRNKDIPGIGMPVMDASGKEIGCVEGIIGPTRNPFILVQGKVKAGDKVYV